MLHGDGTGDTCTSVEFILPHLTCSAEPGCPDCGAAAKGGLGHCRHQAVRHSARKPAHMSIIVLLRQGWEARCCCIYLTYSWLGRCCLLRMIVTLMHVRPCGLCVGQACCTHLASGAFQSEREADKDHRQHDARGDHVITLNTCVMSQVAQGVPSFHLPGVARGSSDGDHSAGGGTNDAVRTRLTTFDCV